MFALGKLLPPVAGQCAILALLAGFGVAAAAEEKPQDKAAHATREDPEYCGTVVRVAASAKIAAQEAKLRELEKLARQRGDELDMKRRELEAAIAKYESLLNKATETLVLVYSKMKPDAAAAQFAVLEDDVAVALLVRLNPKASSQILSEMAASRSAGLIKKLAEVSSAAAPGKPK